MKIQYLVCILIFVCNIAFAQKDTIFYDALWQITSKTDAQYFRIIEKEGNIYKLSDFYKGGKKQMEGYSLSDKEDILTGRTVYYNDLGLKDEEGNFVNNIREGVWKHYKPYIEEEVLWYTDTYVSGVRMGELISYYDNGTVKTKEFFTDTVSTGKRFDDNGKEIAYVPFLVMPKFIGSLTEYFKANMKYPEYCKKKGIEGKVLIRFTVADDGNVYNARVIKSVHPILDDEALRLITSMPKWVPGKIDGEAAHVPLTQPVVFKLTK